MQPQCDTKLRLRAFDERVTRRQPVDVGVELGVDDDADRIDVSAKIDVSADRARAASTKSKVLTLDSPAVAKPQSSQHCCLDLAIIEPEIVLKAD